MIVSFLWEDSKAADSLEDCRAAIRHLHERLGRTDHVDHLLLRLTPEQCRSWLAAELQTEKSHLRYIRSLLFGGVVFLIGGALLAVLVQVPMPAGFMFYADDDVRPFGFFFAGGGAVIVGLTYLELRVCRLARRRANEQPAAAKFGLSITFAVGVAMLVALSCVVIPWLNDRAPPGTTFVGGTAFISLAMGVLTGAVFAHLRSWNGRRPRAALDHAEWTVTPLLVFFVAWRFASLFLVCTFTTLALGGEAWLSDNLGLVAGLCISATLTAILLKYITSRRRARDWQSRLSSFDDAVFLGGTRVLIGFCVAALLLVLASLVLRA